jgi:hypothetical protein
MKKAPFKNEKSITPFIVPLSPDDWKVTPRALVKIICQQPAQIYPFHFPHTPLRVPRFEVWQLNDFFYSDDQPLT